MTMTEIANKIDELEAEKKTIEAEIVALWQEKNRRFAQAFNSRYDCGLVECGEGRPLCAEREY